MPFIHIPSMQSTKFNNEKGHSGYTITNIGDALFHNNIYPSDGVSIEVRVEPDEDCSREALVPYDLKDHECDSSQNMLHAYKIHMYPPAPSYCDGICESGIICPTACGFKPKGLERRLTTNPCGYDVMPRSEACHRKKSVNFRRRCRR